MADTQERPVSQGRRDKETLLAASRVNYLRENYQRLANDLEQIATEDWNDDGCCPEGRNVKDPVKPCKWCGKPKKLHAQCTHCLGDLSDPSDGAYRDHEAHLP